MEIKIDNFVLKKGNKSMIIAELSANHLQNFDIAVKIIEAAAMAGADAIKLQTYTPDTITLNCDNEYFKINQNTVWDGRTLYDLYEEAYTPWEWHEKLQKVAKDNGLIFFSSPFDKTAVNFLEKIKVPVYKIASFEITDIPLIEYVASKGKPVIISTGIAEKQDINLAVAACRSMKNNQIILLKCTSAYPSPLEELNLKMIPVLSEDFQVLSGLSDHTMDSIIPTIAVSLGAVMIEKHLIIDRKMGGPDASFSLEPHEFKNMVKRIRETEIALGKVQYDLTESMKINRNFSRSLFVVEDIKKGDFFTETNIRSIRPGSGLHPSKLASILGKKAKSDIRKGIPLSKEFIEY